MSGKRLHSSFFLLPFFPSIPFPKKKKPHPCLTSSTVQSLEEIYRMQKPTQEGNQVIFFWFSVRGKMELPEKQEKLPREALRKVQRGEGNVSSKKSH